MKPCDVEDTHDSEGLEIFYPEMELRIEADASPPMDALSEESLVESYWKMSHIFSILNPAFDRWLPLIEDDTLNFSAFVKKIGTPFND